jgi:hypothetical protein
MRSRRGPSARREPRAPGVELPRDDREREHVGRRRRRLAARLLGRHVARLAAQAPPLEGRREARARDAEVEDLAVALPVRVVEPGGDLGDHVARDRHRHAHAPVLRAGHRAAQVGALDQLHREVELAVGLSEVEDLDDVAVVQLDGDPRLVDEAADEPALVRLVGEDPLERLDLLEPGDADRLDLVDLGHPTLRDPLEDVVLADPVAEALHRPRW